MPYFFLSYARVDGDGYLEKFYDDLCRAVRSRTGYRLDDIGFRDEANLQLGVNWSTGLVEALSSARVFVAVCSPSYFASEICGKEWQTFLQVSKARQRSVPAGSASLLPITWTPTALVPEAARRLQTSNAALGSTYTKEGLHFLAKLRRFRDEYEMFITRLAEHIVALGEAVAPVTPPVAVSFDTAPSAFGPDSKVAEIDGTAHRSGSTDKLPVAPFTAETLSRPRSGVPGAQTFGGPRHVHFVVVAAPEHELARVRRDTSFYGATPYDWAPYQPQSSQRICVFAQSIASTKDLTSALSTAESSILDLLSRAREQNEIVVLLVDVWTTRLEPYHQVMLEYDERNVPTSAVMVPWNEADEELGSSATELHADVRLAFPNNSARKDTVFRSAVPSSEAFQVALEEVLAEAQSRVFQLGTVARRAGGSRVIDRPLLTPSVQPPGPATPDLPFPGEGNLP